MASQENTTAAIVAESTSSARYSSSSTLATLFTPLSKLKSLRITLIKGSDGHVLQSIQHLTALQELSLSNYIGDGMELEWQGLRKLQYLSLYDHPKLASLPVGLQQATSLRHLTISNCPRLACSHPKLERRSSSAKRRRIRYDSMKKHELKSQLYTKIFGRCSGSTSQ
nr:hypothetical protein CFP56_14164 [Quercus suber]